MKRLRKNEIKNFKEGTRSILDAAFAGGASVYKFFENERVFILKKGGKEIWLRGPRLSVSNPVSLWIIKDKFLTKEAMKAIGVPFPAGYPAKTIPEAIKIARKIKFPVIVKPRRGEGGENVFLNITSEDKLIKFFPKVSKHSPQVLIEKQVFGKYYRITMVDYKIAGILETHGILLVGNGKDTIRKLIEVHTKKFGSVYEINKKTLDILSFQDLVLTSILRKNQKAILGFSGAEGGEWIDKTNSISKENSTLLKKLTRHLDLKLAGIDLIAKDISLPITSPNSPGYVLELNGAPEFLFHMNPTQGKSRNIGEKIINMLLK